MSENSKIEWTDHTFNPWEGCQKVGPGCDHCYAETRNSRFGGGVAINWGPGAPRRRTSAANWRKPLAWNAAHAEFFAQHGRRQRVFCASLADVFDNAVEPAWRRDLFDLIELTPNLDWLLLTKRIGNAFEMIARAKVHDWLMGQRNVCLGATICNQVEADRDIPKLLAVPARRRFLSMEPLLGAVDLRFHKKTWGGDRCNHCCNGDRCDDPTHYDRPCCPYCRGTGKQKVVDWVITGGESGPGARLWNPAWARSLRDQCAAAGVPFLYKQHGEWLPAFDYYSEDDNARDAALDRPYKLVTPDGSEWSEEFDGQPPLGTWIMHRVGKKAAGRLLDGVQHDGFPSGSTA